MFMDDKKPQLFKGLIALGLLIALIYFNRDSYPYLINILQYILAPLLLALLTPLVMLFLKGSGHKTFWDGLDDLRDKPFQHDPVLRDEFIRGYTTFKNAGHKVAIKIFDELLEKSAYSQDRGIVAYFTAISHHIRKDFDSAITYYKMATRLCPDLDMAWANLGSLYRKKGNYSEAAECLKKAIEINDENPWAHNNMANLYISQHDTDQAIFHATRALDLAKNMYQSTQVLAVAYAVKGQMPLAKEYYKKSKKQRRRSTQIVRRLLDDAYSKDKINMKKLYIISEK
jgi:tetratricopeptide (TPR) repeat protein